MDHQIHHDGNPLHGSVVILLDIGQERGDGMMVPVEENDRLLFQDDDVRIQKLVELQKVVDVVEEMEVWIVVDIGGANRVVEPVLQDIPHNEIADARRETRGRRHQEQIVNHHEAGKCNRLPILHDPLQKGKTQHIASNHGDNRLDGCERGHSPLVPERGAKLHQRVDHPCYIKQCIQNRSPHDAHNDMLSNIENKRHDFEKSGSVSFLLHRFFLLSR